MSKDPDYHRRIDRDAKAAKTADKNEISAILDGLPVPSEEEIKAIKWDLSHALRTLFPQAFKLPFSRDHQRFIETMQRVLIDGGQLAVAMPRGYGKTTISVRAAIWATMLGHRRSTVMVAASNPAALKLLKGFKDEVRFNDRLLKYFPKPCMAMRLLQGKASKTTAQTYHGAATSIVWKSDELVLPTIPGEECSAARVGVAGITGGNLRGQHHTTVSGEVIRPDIVIVDDPQDRESAKSPTQTQDRLDILAGDVMGMSGPDVKMSCIVPCTVIQEGDLADQLLDRTKNPQWQGIRTKMLDAMPTDERHWEEYRDRRARGLREERDPSYWNDYLRENWDAMHAGAVACWPERFKPDELSAVQSAMNWYFDSPTAFAAEAQNEPVRTQKDSIDPIRAADVADKANGIKRGIIPVSATHLTAFVDVQGKLLYWMVAAFSDDMTGHVVDYGTMPDQKRLVFTLNDAKRSLAHLFPGSTQEGQIYDGLSSLAGSVIGSSFVRQDGALMQVERFLVDSGWQTDTIYKWSRETPYRQMVSVSKGRGLTAKSVPMSDYKPRTGEKIGHYWLQKTVGKGVPTRVVEPDTNYWKTQAYRRLRLSKGDAGTITLFGSPSDHPTLSAHFAAEYPIEKEEQGRRVWEWHQRVERPDNHWWDCLIGCMVGASMAGCQVGFSQVKPQTSAGKQRRSLAEMAGRR